MGRAVSMVRSVVVESLLRVADLRLHHPKLLRYGPALFILCLMVLGTGAETLLAHEPGDPYEGILCWRCFCIGPQHFLICTPPWWGCFTHEYDYCTNIIYEG